MNEIKYTTSKHDFEVIIIGGSYSGLSAAMTLGRSLRRVLVIDNGQPCNRQTPYSHNFITHDGKTPEEISTLARRQVEEYSTVQFLNGLAVKGIKTGAGFQIETQAGEVFTANRLIFATGVKDIVPEITGFAECWGISVIHCPYCHGYEVRNEITGILDNGETAMHLAGLVNNLTKKLSILTNGKSAFSPEQAEKLQAHSIPVIEKEIDRIEQTNGQLKRIIFKDGSPLSMRALYARVPFIQHSDIPEKLGCELAGYGLIKVDAFQQTSIQGIFACGDNTISMRSVANAVAMGNLAGAMVNKQLCDAQF